MNHQYEGQLEEPEDDWFDDEDGEWCDACYRATATPSEYQWWADFEATRNGRERCDSYIERGEDHE